MKPGAHRIRSLATAGAVLGLAALRLGAASGLESNLAGELLASSDIRLAELAWQPRVEAWGGRWGASLELAGTAIDYAPNQSIDPFGVAHTVEDTRLGLALDWRRDQGPWRLQVGASAYDGFRSYTALWIDEYYRQQYGAGGLPGAAYEDPDPRGVGGFLALRYTFQPGGFLTFQPLYTFDVVAPGYEIEDLGNQFALRRGESELQTLGGVLSHEQVLHPEVRVLNTLGLSRTTTRALRTALRSEFIWAPHPDWTYRAAASLTHEGPDFWAGSLSLTADRALGEAWGAFLTLRAYEDTGQIESANLVTSAAPELATQQILLGLRQTTGAGGSWQLAVGPYWTDYAAVGLGSARFAGLYRDRTWLQVRAAWTIDF